MARPALVFAAVVLLVVAANAEAPTERTEVQGDVPAELVGRWFAVAQGKVASGAGRTIARAWEIRRGAEHLELVLRRAPLPKAITDAIQAAATAKQEWHPDDRDLRAVATSWDDPPAPENRVEIVSRLVSSAAFDSDLAGDAATKGSELAIVIDERFNGAEHVARTTSVYGVRSRTPTALRGTFVGTTIAIVFAAVPITFTGDFEAYRLDARPASWLARLFSGCGR